MTDHRTEIAATTLVAMVAEDAFDAALKAHGYKSRWDWAASDEGTDEVYAAYVAKIRADEAMGLAWERSREAA